jgi:hypothetical protein
MIFFGYIFCCCCAEYLLFFLLVTLFHSHVDLHPLRLRRSSQVQGEWQHTVGSEGDQPGKFSYPRGLALTPDDDFLLVVDSGNHRVAVLRALDGAWVRQLTGPPGTLRRPCGVAVVPSTGEVLVSDVGHNCVIRFRSIDDDTVVGTLATGQGTGPTQFNGPCGLVVLNTSHHLSVFVFFAVYGINQYGAPSLVFGLVMGLAGRPRGRGG